LHNWLVKVYRIEIISQWHFERVCNDSDYHHFYCDLTIKNPNNSFSVAILELLAIGSALKLQKHFDQVLKYANLLCPQEFWVIHFFREDFVILDPY